MIKKYLLIFFVFISINLFAQTNYNGNGNTGFGGPIGQSVLNINDDGTTITFTLTKGSADFNDALVLYLDTGVAGRNIIDSNVNDNQDGLRKAISNGDANGTPSVVTFESSFNASHAIAVANFFGGLWSIPATGPISDNDLPFIATVTSGFNVTDPVVTFTVLWSDLGLTGTDSFDFVGLYLSDTAFNSDEGFGNGITPGSSGGDNVTFTDFLTYSNTLSLDDQDEFSNARVFTQGNQIGISGLNTTIDVVIYNILGQSVYERKNIRVQNNELLQWRSEKRGVYLVKLSQDGRQKTLKVLLN